jgi:hypothetical protein
LLLPFTIYLKPLNDIGRFSRLLHSQGDSSLNQYYFLDLGKKDPFTKEAHAGEIRDI